MPRPRRPLLLTLLLATFFCALAPTLRWLQFSGGSENLVVGTVLEMRRPHGPWLIPNLKGQPRVTKPPLAAWITAAAARPHTIAALHDPATRDQAYTDLAWQVRYPALLATLLLLLATYDLARTLSSPAPNPPAPVGSALTDRISPSPGTGHHVSPGDGRGEGRSARHEPQPPTAASSPTPSSILHPPSSPPPPSLIPHPAFPLLATAIAATTILTLRFCRSATTDVYLALFVTLANAAAARAFFLPRHKALHSILAGLFVGLGAMSKGPPVLAQTAAPILAFAAYQYWTTRRRQRPNPTPEAAFPPIVPPTPASTASPPPAIPQPPSDPQPPAPPSSILHPPSSPPTPPPPHSALSTRHFLPLFLLATAVTLLIALPWPAYVLYTRGAGQLDYWSGEVLNGGRNPTFVPDPFYAYASIFPLMLPWLPLFLWGIAATLHHTFARLHPHTPLSERSQDPDRSAPSSILHPPSSPFFALLLAFVPILVMSCFTQKNERYLLPMLAPCALVAAFGLTLPTPKKFLPWRRLTLAAQWILLFALALSPLATPFLKTANNAPWTPWPLALTTTAILLTLSVLAWLRDRRASTSSDPQSAIRDPRSPHLTSDLRPLTSPPSILHPLSSPLPLATFLSTLALQLLFMHGYARTDAGLSEIKPLADTIALNTPPNLPVYNYYPKNARHKAPIDLLIYLDRLVTPTHIIDPTTPQVLVLYHDPQKPLPPALTDWTLIATAQRDHGTWEAYLPPHLNFFR